MLQITVLLILILNDKTSLISACSFVLFSLLINEYTILITLWLVIQVERNVNTTISSKM